MDAMNRWSILAPLLLLGACSGSGDAGDTAAQPVALVKLAPATQGAAPRQLTVYGAAEPGPAGKMSLAAPAKSKVVAIDAPPGTAVRAGQTVVRLAPSAVTRADAAKAASDAAAADKALARALRLRSDGLSSDADVEAARAAAASANALKASFSDRTGGLTLRAPAAGIVDAVPVVIGDLLQPGAAVASVTRTGDVRVKFGIDPDGARSVRPGMRLHIAGVGSRPPIDALVESVSVAVDAQTRLASLYARLPAGSGIVAGEALTATVELPDTSAGISVPYAALLDDAGQPYVFAVAGGVAHRRNVTVAPSSGDRVTITQGLRAGDRVVVEGGTALEDGMKVRTR